MARLKPWGMVALVFALVLICYWPALHGKLLWDDDAHVTKESLRSVSGLVLIWTEVLATQQYYPVLHSTFWIEHRLWGDSTFGYHLINILQHATACCLLALVLQRLWTPTTTPESRGNRTVPAGTEWFAAMLFAVHPVCVESVAWISEQKNTLSLVFYLLAALTYLNFSRNRRGVSYAVATFFFVLALGTKTVTATLPAALLVIFWWRNGTLSWKRDVVPLLPWFAAALIAGLSTAWIEKNLIGADGTEYGLSLIDRILLAGRVVWFYFGSLVWPANLAFFYELWDVPTQATSWIGYLVGAVVVTSGLWAVRGRTRGPLAVWLLFVGSLFPALGFFNVYPFAFSYVADHFQYLASISIVAGAALLLSRLPRPARAAIHAIAAALIAILALFSREQSSHYLNDESLFRASIAQVPDNWMAQLSLASAIARQPGRESEALPHAEKAVSLNPLSPNAHQRLGELLERTPGRQQEALQHFECAIELRPIFAEAHYHVALLLKGDPKRLPEVIQHLEAALETKPLMAEAHHQLANALLRVPKRFPEAMAHFEQAIYLKPDLAGAHYDYANVLARLPGKLPDAISHYRKTVELLPNFAGAHYNLANALAQSGQTKAAIAEFEAALQINSDFAPAHYDLAILLSEMPGRETEAIRHASETLRIDPGNVEAHNLLAVIYAQQGLLDQAKTHWEKALELDPDYATARENLRLLEEMQKQ